MEILFTKSFWEFDLAAHQDPIGAFMSRVAADGFDGTEMFLPLLTEDPARVLELHAAHGLSRRIIDIVTEGASPADHRASFDASVERALSYEPDLINSHTGRDIFSFEDNVALYRHAVGVSADVGVPIVHETHRFRPTYSAVETRRYLEAVPGLFLTADLSHWFVVHESDLSDQDQNVELALARSRHIHARVGFEEGPQVGDPADPRWRSQLDRHLELWQRIVDGCRHAGVPSLAITPEFGPFPYVPMIPFTDEPVADPWAANLYMKDLLSTRLV